VIREAAAGDTASVAALHLATALVAYADIFPKDVAPPGIDDLTAEYDELIDRGGRLWVWEDDDGEIAGSITLVDDPSVPAGQRLDRFYVYPHHQGRGIGRRLYEHLLVQARGPALNLWVLEANAATRAIYEAWGWELVPGRTLPNDPPHILDVLYELGPGSLATDP